MSQSLERGTMSTKGKVLLVFAFVTIVYFLVGGDTEPVEVEVESE